MSSHTIREDDHVGRRAPSTGRLCVCPSRHCSSRRVCCSSCASLEGHETSEHSAAESEDTTREPEAAHEAGTEATDSESDPALSHDEQLLGVDTSNWALLAAGALLSAIATATIVFSRRRSTDAAVAVFAGLFAAADLIDGSRALSNDETTTAVIAIGVAALHVAALAVTGWIVLSPGMPKFAVSSRRCPVSVLRALALYAVAAVAEIGGAWLIWQGAREHRGITWIGAGIVALAAYGFVATLQEDANFGRILAAYGGIFVAGSLAWGIVADGFKPDRFDYTSAVICLDRRRHDHVPRRRRMHGVLRPTAARQPRPRRWDRHGARARRRDRRCRRWAPGRGRDHRSTTPSGHDDV